MQSILKLVVWDGQGVMDRIVGHVRRFGCNISSVTAGEVEDGVSDIVIAFHTQGVDMEMLGRRLSNLDCVKSWEEFGEGGFVREMMMGKVAAEEWDKLGLEGARILERSDGHIYFEYTDTFASINEIMRRLRLLDCTCTRSGPVCLSKQGEEG